MEYTSNGLPKDPADHKILLGLLPFWSPLIPPIGIACLKTHLSQFGYNVHTIDANIEIDFNELYDHYFEIIKKNMPDNRKGNFFSIGHDVLRNQMMAYLNYTDEEEYIALVKTLVYKTYYVHLGHDEILEMNTIIETFYSRLETYLLNLLEKENPTVFGLSVFSGTLPSSLFAFRLVRKYFPNVKTVMGGGVFADQLAEGSENYEIFMKETEPYLDGIIMGEGEVLFHKWLKGELSASKRAHGQEDLKGESLDLSKVGVLDIRDFDCKQYPYIVSYTSRSCPFQCSFCSETVQWGGYRKKTARQIYEELTELYNRHGMQLFLLSDSLLNPIIRQLVNEFKESDASLYWGGWFRVDSYACDLKHTFDWRRSGFYQARLGIESGSPHVLKLMHKLISVNQIRESVSSLAQAGIKTTTLWVVGHPGETEEDFQATLDLLEELRNDIYDAECRPFYYYAIGQVGSQDDTWGWGNANKLPLYPPESQDMLMFQTWLLDCEPHREIAYERMNRFVKHCENLGIPNPYSMREIFEADQRWKRLHKNAVPALVEFKDANRYITENKTIQRLNYVKPAAMGQQTKNEYVNFGF